MGALANAVSLMNSVEWRDWLKAAAAYQAREVVLEPEGTARHALRLKLAEKVITSPEYVVGHLVTIISTDPDVAAKGGTPTAVTENVVIAKVAASWSRMAELLLPEYADLP